MGHCHETVVAGVASKIDQDIDILRANGLRLLLGAETCQPDKVIGMVLHP